MCGIPSIYFPSECLSHTVGPRSRGNVSGSAATDTVWIRTNRPCLSYFRPHRGVAELLFAGRLFPPVSKLGYRLRKYGYFGYYNVNENGSRKVLCTADGMRIKRVAPASFSGPVTMAWKVGSLWLKKSVWEFWSLYEKCLRRQYQHCTVCIHCYPGFQSKAGSKILRGPALFYVSIP